MKPSSSISDQVVVIEREFKSQAVHKDTVTGIVDLGETEFLTTGLDNSLKIWDKNSQQCDYTIETHECLWTLKRTGENNNILVASLGQGDLIIYRIEKETNQLSQVEILEKAHHEHVIQIVSLQKLKNKYFATRCLSGNLNIWSSAMHPDKLFTIDNIDRDESILLETILSKNDSAHNAGTSGGHHTTGEHVS